MDSNIPKQKQGSKMDVVAEAKFDDEIMAKEFYPIARMRLLEVYNWDEICGYGSATFTLLDERGQEVKRAAMEGDYFKINIPGPGSTAGEGYDFVRVEQVQEESSASNQATSIRVRPCPNPLTEDKDVAHFFKDEATSTFVVNRMGAEVLAEVHGRNEMPNTEAKGIVDKIRNTAVGLGAKVGLSYPQWKVLVRALVDKK